MKKKIFVSLGLALALGVTGFVSTAYAGNISDSPYKFYFSMKGSVAHTEARPKYDDTSAYMRLDGIQNGCGGFKVKVVNGGGGDFSRVWWSRPFNEYTPNGTEEWIKNYAYEDSGYGVQVKLKGEGGGGFVGSGIWHTTGVWSPDSVGGN